MLQKQNFYEHCSLHHLRISLLFYAFGWNIGNNNLFCSKWLYMPRGHASANTELQFLLWVLTVRGGVTRRLICRRLNREHNRTVDREMGRYHIQLEQVNRCDEIKDCHRRKGVDYLTGRSMALCVVALHPDDSIDRRFYRFDDMLCSCNELTDRFWLLPYNRRIYF